MEGEWFCYRGGLFNGEGIGHVREVASLKGRDWLCYVGGQFNRQKRVMLQRWSV